MIYGNVRKPIFHPDVQAVINIAVANSEELPSQIYLSRLSETIYQLEDNGIWSLLDLAIFSANELREFSKYCFKRHIKMTEIGDSLPYNSNGFRGFGQYIARGFNTGFNPYLSAVNYQKDNASAYVFTSDNSGVGNFLGCIGISPATGRVNIGQGTTTLYSVALNGGNVNIAPSNLISNHLLISRNNSANFILRTDNGTVTVTSASTTLPNNTIGFLCRNTSGSLLAPNANTPTNGSMSVALIGAYLEDKQEELRTIIDNYLKLTY